MTWKQEYREICEVINQTPETQAKRALLKKDVKKTLRRVGSIDYNLFPVDFRWNLCAARLRMGRFDNWDGWEFRSDWAITCRGLNGHQWHIPIWKGEECKKLIILGEQGIGDEILFASAIPELIVRLGRERLEFQTYPRIIETMRRSFGISCVSRKRLSEIDDVEDGVYAIGLADLLMFYRRDKSHFPGKPYLKPDPILVTKWRKELEQYPGKKIGIGWKARHGSLSPQDLMCEEASYINLQYLEHPNGVWSEDLPEGVIDFGINPLEDIESHMALISCLDKVVTVTQTTVHECGALGVECHAIRPKKGTGEVHNMLWYYGLGNCDMVIYNSVKIWNTPKDYQKYQERLSRDRTRRS